MSAPTYRFERKFEAVQRMRADVELLVKLHPAHFRRAYPFRFINNVYFDTPDLEDFSTHVNGAAERSKLRLRWYGDGDGPIARSTLEEKIRRGYTGRKRSLQLGAVDVNGTIDMKSLVRAIQAAGGPPELIERIACRRPAVFNRYRRDYYVSGDGCYRVTIDSALEFRGVNGHRAGGYRHWREDDLVIIELKYDAQYDPGASDVSGTMPFRLGRLSKYVRGIQRLMGWETY